MSVDISYYSFSPSRADFGWKNFARDIVPIREKHKEWAPRHKIIQAQLKKEQEYYEKNLEPVLAKKRQEIFKIYEKEGLFIPGIDWDKDTGVDEQGNPFRATDEDKMDYLLIWGPLYPKGFWKGGAAAARFMYKEDKAEYQALKKKIEEKKSLRVPQELPKLPEVTLTPAQEAIDRGAEISYLAYEHEFNEVELRRDLKFLDLYYGSVRPEAFPDTSSTYDLIPEAFNLVDEIMVPGQEYPDFQISPDRYKWIGIYGLLQSGSYFKQLQALMDLTDWDKNECEELIRDFFLCMKPLVQDLKNSPDAILVKAVDGQIAEPRQAYELLSTRAQLHQKEFTGLIPPVL